MKPVEFVVYATPIPQGSKSVAMRGKRPVMYDDNPGIPAWRKAITAAAKAAGLSELKLDGPLHVSLHFFLARPKAHYRAGEQLRDDAPYWVITKPDSDKLARGVYDALTIAGVVLDDRFISSGQQVKTYTAGSPGVQIRIHRLTQPEKE